jgi:hypothetical protein
MEAYPGLHLPSGRGNGGQSDFDTGGEFRSFRKDDVLYGSVEPHQVRRFSDTGWADDGQEFSLFNAEIDPLDNLFAAVP